METLYCPPWTYLVVCKCLCSLCFCRTLYTGGYKDDLRTRKRILSFLEISRTPTMDELVTEIAISDYENGCRFEYPLKKHRTHMHPVWSIVVRERLLESD